MLRKPFFGLFVFVLCCGAVSAESLQIKLTDHGLTSLTYLGVEYCNPSGCGVLGFTGQQTSHGNVWAPAVVDAQKKPDAFTPVPTAAVVKGSTVTLTYPWGALAATYTVKDADLYITATLTNTSQTPIGWWKANLLQLNSRLVFDKNAQMPYGYAPNMHWDYRWAMWGGGFDAYETWNFSDPHVYWWVDAAPPFETRLVTVFFADLDPKWQTGVNHVKTEAGDAWPVVGAADGDPGGTQQIAPGQSDTVHLVLRFRAVSVDDGAALAQSRAHLQSLTKQATDADAAVKRLKEDPDTDLKDVREAEDTLAAQRAEVEKARAAHAALLARAMPSALDVCADGYEAFGRAYPRTVHWTDRRPIGTYFAGRGAKSTATNPNRWFNDPTVDTTTPEGRQAFAVRLLAEIDATIVVLKDVGAQGVIWWDVEGERWPQMTTYIGDPRVLDPAHPLHDQFAPELDTLVTYNGQQMKLVDACFKKWQDAGLKTGVTIRPQTVIWDEKSKSIQQVWRDTPVLADKATYARERWGSTIFYVDSISEWFGNWLLEPVAKKYPDILLMPEWGRTRSYRHSSQFSYTRFTGFYHGVPAEMQACWPDAFCCMSNYDYEKEYASALDAVKHGNVQLFNCWYAGTEAKKLKQIYQETGIKHIPTAGDQQVTTAGNTPVKITLRATGEDAKPLTFRLLGPPAHGKLGTLDAAAGTITYTPAAGYAGKDRFSFLATDTAGMRSNRGIVDLTIGPDVSATTKGQ